jgi:hypothetical protein
MRSLPDVPVFTTEDAHAAGVTPSALKHAVRRGVLVRSRRGVYTRSQAPELDAAAAVRVIRDAVVSHRSAALLLGLPVLAGPPGRPEITVPPKAAGNHPGVALHRAQLRRDDIVLVGDVPVTSAARTCVDVARHRPLEASVALVDAALHQGLTTREEVEDVVRFCWNWPGIRRAQHAVSLSDGRAESPLESVSRLVIPRLGFPLPALQTWIHDPSGRAVGRSDFYWDEVGVIGEADGRFKYEVTPGEQDPLFREKDRQEEFEDLGLVVVRWGWLHAWRRHDLLGRKLVNGFERGRRRDRSGFPRQWTL